MRPTVQQARAALFSSIAMTVLGTCGLGNGIATASQSRLPAAPELPAEGEPPLELEPGEAQLVAPWYRVIWESPASRPLGALNALVSSMLLVGSFLLTFRRESALWWIRNAVAANVLWIVADAAHRTSVLVRAGPELFERSEAFLRAHGAELGDASGRTMVLVAFGTSLFAAALNVAVHLALAFRCHRPDVRAFIETGARAD